jgi:hypothetical protein
VPVCPLCNKPVPVNRGENPNIKVNEHISQDCHSEKARKTSISKCSFPGCKGKEVRMSMKHTVFDKGCILFLLCHASLFQSSVMSARKHSVFVTDLQLITTATGMQQWVMH